ncbi:MAG: DUF3105 domain-containing protein [Solirubrobacterales bacterium]|nr:DUF3105 domain-containing protein [Solirubrobacterales bacterium]
MSSRQEEKERRKAERLERERAEAGAARRKRLAQIVGGVIVAAAIVAGIVFAAAGGDGGGDDSSEPSQQGERGLPIPAQRETDLQKAVRAAGCTFKEFESEGQTHVNETLTPADFKTNPPTSGQHDPVPAEDGVYEPAGAPAFRNWVHTLEHGRILLQYKPGTPQPRVRQLRTLFNEPVAGGPEGYHLVLMQNDTDMPFQVAAVAWTRYVGCKEFTDRTFDALRAFRDLYVDKAPEQVP